MSSNPFIRSNDGDYDSMMAEKCYVSANIHKKWGSTDSFDAVIKKVIFRGDKSWIRMDIDVQTPRGSLVVSNKVCFFLK